MIEEQKNLSKRQEEMGRLIEALERLEYERNKLAQKISALKNQIHAERDFEFCGGDNGLVYGWVENAGLALEIQTPEKLEWKTYGALDIRFYRSGIKIYGSNYLHTKLIGRIEKLDLNILLEQVDFSPLLEKDSQ